MPRFDFKCKSCGLIFEKFISQKDNTTSSTIPCIDCKAESEKQLPDVAFTFASGKVVGNSGVDSLDTDIDKAVGRDADKRWESIKKRDSEKKAVQQDNGGIGKVPIRKNTLTGEYEPMKDAEVKRFQNLHREYDEIYKEHKKDRESKGLGKFSESDPYTKYRKSKE